MHQGLEELHEGHRKEFFEAFGVEDKAAVKFNKQHPPPEAPSDEEEGPDSGDDADHEPGQPASKKQKRQPGAIGKENHKASGAKATPASPPVHLFMSYTCPRPPPPQKTHIQRVTTEKWERKLGLTREAGRWAPVATEPSLCLLTLANDRRQLSCPSRAAQKRNVTWCTMRFGSTAMY